MKKAIAFSGGKDSWACLWLNESLLHEIDVIWVNTGKNFPEVLELIEFAKTMCPNFHEVAVDRDAQNFAQGLPSDIVPVDWSIQGQQFSGKKDVSIQSYLGCCFENISYPMHMKVKELGIAELIVGQRDEESKKSPAKDGQIIDGVVRRFPIRDWTSEDVISYLRTKMKIPEHFSFLHSSMDCYDCTAYVKDTKDRDSYFKKNHPALYEVFISRKTKLTKALNDAILTQG